MHLPVLEDQPSLQMASTKVCPGVVDKSLDPKLASTLSYGMQAASTAVSKPMPRARNHTNGGVKTQYVGF